MSTTVLVRATGRQLRAILLSGLVVVQGGVSACEREGTAQRIGLRYVTDGDTLVLADGRRVRLIGINTP